MKKLFLILIIIPQMLFAQNTNIEGNISYFGFDDLDDTYYPKIKITLLDKDYLGFKVDFSLVQRNYRYSFTSSHHIHNSFSSNNSWFWNPR